MQQFKHCIDLNKSYWWVVGQVLTRSQSVLFRENNRLHQFTHGIFPTDSLFAASLGFGLFYQSKKLKTKTDTPKESRIFWSIEKSELILTSIFDQICFNCPQNLGSFEESQLFIFLTYST